MTRRAMSRSLDERVDRLERRRESRPVIFGATGPSLESSAFHIESERTLVTADDEGYFDISYPAFSAPPVVVLTESGGSAGFLASEAPENDHVRCRAWEEDHPQSGPIQISWVAIGPP